MGQQNLVVEDEVVFGVGGLEQQHHPQVKIRRLLTDRVLQQTTVQLDPAAGCVHKVYSFLQIEMLNLDKNG